MLEQHDSSSKFDMIWLSTVIGGDFDFDGMLGIRFDGLLRHRALLLLLTIVLLRFSGEYLDGGGVY